MAYVLVCVHDDEATREAAAMADDFKTKGHPTAHHFAGASPDHDAVRAALAEGDALLTAHNGKLDGQSSIRSQSRGGVWADEAVFARTFQGARVYVYACNTMGENGVPSLSSFGRSVQGMGVRVFVGHCCAVTTVGETNPLGGPFDQQDEQFKEVIHAVWEAFLEGVDDEDGLRLRGMRAGPAPEADGLFGLLQIDSKLSDVINALCVSRG